MNDELTLPASQLSDPPAEAVTPDSTMVTLTVRGLSVSVHYLHLAPTDDAAPILLLLHGHSPAALEFSDLLPQLYEADGFEVFAFDQPNNGLSGDLAVADVRAQYKDHPGFECLYFLRDLIDAFVAVVIAPGQTGRKVVVAGGSLGGNLSLLVAERQPKYEWLERVVAWSPGSSWKEDAIKWIGAQVAYGRANATWTQDAFARGTYIDPVASVVGIKIYPPQPYYWYFDCWGEERVETGGQCIKKGGGACDQCKNKPLLGYPEDDHYPGMGSNKELAIERGFRAMMEGFTECRARWQWETNAEQVAFSHWGNDGGRPRYAALACDVDFLAGTCDDRAPSDLFHSTQSLYAAARSALAGTGLRLRARWLEETGHAIAHERPYALTQILARQL